MISLLMSSVGFAEGDFTAKKQEVLTRIDEKLVKMQEHKTCVAAAQKQEDMQKCHGMMREAHMEKRMEHMEKKKGRLEERIKKMEEKTPSEAPKQ